jgi:TolB-like protein
MSDSPAQSDAPPTAVSTDGAANKKKRNKVRAAWISFISRILAQFVGSAATVVLGLMFLHKYQTTRPEAGADAPRKAPSAERVVVPARDRREPGHTALAVLPLANFSADSKKQEHIANAMTEALITALSQVEGLHVTSRTSSMPYQDVRKPLPEIARELGVDWILEGSVLVSEEHIRVVAQLIDSATDEHIWAAMYDRRLHDVLSVQAELASLIAREVDGAIVRGQRRSNDSKAGEDLGRGLQNASQAMVGTSGASRRP